MLQRVYPEVAQNAAGQGTESGAAGLSCRYNYDMEVWMSYESDVTFTHWFPIPKLPKE